MGRLGLESDRLGPRRAGADEGGFDGPESTESASDKESVGSVMWERWDKEGDRGEMGGGVVERETLDVEKNEEMKLVLTLPSEDALFGRRPLLTARS